ncbi:MAG: methylmalonyl-CoA mutase family protein [Planctomycetota bacterium]
MTDAGPAFPIVSLAAWRARVEEELGSAELTDGGLDVAPLYTRRAGAEDDPAGFPGLWPGTRGATPGGRREGPERIAVAAIPAFRDPLGELAASGAVAGGLEAAFAALVRAVAAAGPGDRPAGISTLPYHEAGATPLQELALALASGIAVLRHLEAAGIAPANGAARIAFRFAVDRDVFAEIAKLRAARALWSRVLAACGVLDPPPMWVHAVGSPRALARRDPWTNVLRGTTQMFAAICGGAGAVTALPFDSAGGAPSELGLRLARNTLAILVEESRLGRVIDPAGGSWYVEERTEAMARGAWEELRSLEAAGGLPAALLSGEVRRRLDASWAERRAAIAHRRLPITGVSEFPAADAPLRREPVPPPPPPAPGVARIAPLPRRRDAAPFEALRDAADALPARPAIHLANLGPAGEHRSRAIFAASLFRAGGFLIVEEEGTGDAAPAAAAALLAARFRASGAGASCLCGADSRYAAAVPGAAAALREAGARPVLLAGRPGERESLWRAAGVDGFVHAGLDMLAVLTDLLAAHGARPPEEP